LTGAARAGRLLIGRAAIGRAQLAKLPAAVERRRAFVRALAERLADVPSVQVPELPDGAEPSFGFCDCATAR